MKREQFKEELARIDMNQETFSILVRLNVDTVYRWGRNGGDVPHWVVLLLRMIRERRTYRDLFRDNN